MNQNKLRSLWPLMVQASNNSRLTKELAEIICSKLDDEELDRLIKWFKQVVLNS